MQDKNRRPGDPRTNGLAGACLVVSPTRMRWRNPWRSRLVVSDRICCSISCKFHSRVQKAYIILICLLQRFGSKFAPASAASSRSKASRRGLRACSSLDFQEASSAVIAAFMLSDLEPSAALEVMSHIEGGWIIVRISMRIWLFIGEVGKWTNIFDIPFF